MIKAKIELDRLDDILNQTDDAVELAALEQALRVKDRSIELAPEETGATKFGHYVKTRNLNEYSRAAEDAMALKDDAELWPDDQSVDAGEAIVAVATVHSTYIHEGTAFVPPNPFLLEAFTQEQASYERSLADKLSKVK